MTRIGRAGATELSEHTAAFRIRIRVVRRQNAGNKSSRGDEVPVGPELARRYTQLDALYAELPTLACQRKCQEACGPIFLSQIELWRLLRRTKRRALHSDPATLTCPLLSGGRCSVYRIRPLICRLWGLTRAMACPFGCVPTRWLSEAEAQALLARASAVSDGVVVGILPEAAEQRQVVADGIRRIRQEEWQVGTQGRVS